MFEPFYVLISSFDLALVLTIYFLFIAAESPSPPLTKSRRLRKRTMVEYVTLEGLAAVPTTTSGMDEELREAFEAVEQEKELEEKDEGAHEKMKEMAEEVSFCFLAVPAISVFLFLMFLISAYL